MQLLDVQQVGLPAPHRASGALHAAERPRYPQHTAKHLFCSVCGIKSFYVPRSHPDGFSVNARCLDEGTVEARTIEQINGREWEKQYPAGRGEFRDA